MDSLSPFLQGSFIPYNMPVYPGALRLDRHPARSVRARDLWVSAPRRNKVQFLRFAGQEDLSA
jgi:hypothetical protein